MTDNDSIVISRYLNKRNNSEYQISYIYYNPDVEVISSFHDYWYRLDYIEYEKTNGLKEEFLNDLKDLFK